MTLKEAIKNLQETLNNQGAKLKVDGIFGPLTESALKAALNDQPLVTFDLEPALKIIKEYEGCRLYAYKDVVGIWTIGWGHTGPDVYEGLVITQEKADALLMEDVSRFARDVKALVTVSITNNQFCALTSFSFNVGSDIDADDKAEGLGDSTLLKRLNKGDYQGAAEEFLKWINAGGKPFAGLIRRRKAERELFLSHSIDHPVDEPA